jgi:hypothetical protein
MAFRSKWGIQARNEVYDINGPVFVNEPPYETTGVGDT